MAWLEHRGGCFRVVFRYGGTKFQHPLKTNDAKEADRLRVRLEENLMLLERGRLELPPDADLPTFLLSDGKLSTLPQVSKSVTLGELSRQYQDAITISLEANSRATIAIHLRHVLKTFGAAFRVPELKAAHLQEHINRRVNAKGRRKKPLSAYTIRKELVTFGAAFKWGVEMGLLKGTFPNRGLRYPKMVERPPFMTWDEITRRIEAGHLSAEEAKSLWASLFLSRPEIKELLEYVRVNARLDWIYPMMALAAHTGARRSELLRAELSDVDFLSKTILIREMKKQKGRETTRRVPLSPFITQVLATWMKQHPLALRARNGCGSEQEQAVDACSRHP